MPGPENQGMQVNFIFEECGTIEADEAFNCIKQKTFNLTETVLAGQLGLSCNPCKNILDESFWSSDLTVSEHGLCHTINYPDKLGADPFKEVLSFILDEKLQYKILVHDPNFFLLTANPLTIPQITLEMMNNGNPQASMNFLKARVVIML